MPKICLYITPAESESPSSLIPADHQRIKTMKVFAILTVVALLGGSQAAFLGGLSDIFHNLGQEIGEVGKDLLHTATPIATNLLETLKSASTQLLSTAASDLLSKLGTNAGTSKRDLGETITKIASFVTKGEEYVKNIGSLMHGAFNGTLAKINAEINSVMTDAKPLGKLMEEVKTAVAGHNNFLDGLVSKVEQEGAKLVHDIFGGQHTKRGILDFGTSLSQIFQTLAGDLKSTLGSVVTKLESNVLGLLG